MRPRAQGRTSRLNEVNGDQETGGDVSKPSTRPTVVARLGTRRARSCTRHLAFSAGVCGAILLAVATASTAAASTTIGQLAPGNSPAADCPANQKWDVLQPTVTSGQSFVVPPGGTLITSWSTNAAAGPGQTLELKVYRLVSGTTYTVVGHEGPHALTPSMVNTFPASLAVQPGDVIGLGSPAPAGGTACAASGVSDSDLENMNSVGDSQTESFSSFSGYRDNLTAVVHLSNAFSFGKVALNKKKGTATLTVTTSDPGIVLLFGKGIKTENGATGGGQSYTLPVIPKGKLKKKLNKKHKVSVKVSVTFTPTGGTANTQSETIKLKKH